MTFHDCLVFASAFLTGVVVGMLLMIPPLGRAVIAAAQPEPQ